MKTITPYIICIFLFGLTSCSEEYWTYETTPAKKTEEPIRVKTQTVYTSSQKETKSFFGVLNFSKIAQIQAQQSGQIVKLDVAPGQYVQKGEIVLEYPIKEFQIQLDQAQIEYNSIKKEYTRQQELYEAGAVSEVSVEGLKNQLSLQSKTLDLLKQTQVIKAPFSGVITRLNARLGQQVTMGTPLFTIADLSHTELEFYVGSQDIESIRPGDSIQFNHQNTIITGAITEKAVQMDPERKAFKVKALVNHSGTGVQSTGQTVELTVKTNTIRTGIWLPAKAINQFGKRCIAYVVNKGKAERKELTIGYRTQHTLQVTDGLTSGDQVVIAGIDKIEDGTPVKVIK